MPACDNLVPCAPDSLQDTLCCAKFGQTVTEVDPAIHFSDSNPTARYLVLEPQLIELDVALFPKTPPTRDTYCRAGVYTKFDTGLDRHVDSSIDSHIFQHTSDPQSLRSPAHCAIILRFPR